MLFRQEDFYANGKQSTVTVYLGGVYEYVVGTGATTKYHAGNALRRTGYTTDNGVFYLLQDHLHSSSATVSEAGVLSGGYAYYAPFGASRGGQVNLTQKRFTGQYHEATLPGGAGLYDYGARWYDARLGRFVTPDSLVPNPANPQDLNRYSYVRNNPLKYKDPSGHCATYADGSPNLNKDGDCWRWVNTIGAQWEKSKYWSTRWGSKEILLDYIAKSDLDAEYFKSEWERFNQSTEGREASRQARPKPNLDIPTQDPVDAIAVGLGLSADAPVLAILGVSGVIGIEVVATQDGELGLFSYAGGGVTVGVGTNAKVYVARIRNLPVLDDYSGSSLSSDVTTPGPGFTAGTFQSINAVGTHGETFGLGPSANLSLSVNGVVYSRPFWQHKLK